MCLLVVFAPGCRLTYRSCARPQPSERLQTPSDLRRISTKEKISCSINQQRNRKYVSISQALERVQTLRLVQPGEFTHTEMNIKITSRCTWKTWIQYIRPIPIFCSSVSPSAWSNFNKIHQFQGIQVIVLYTQCMLISLFTIDRSSPFWAAASSFSAEFRDAERATNHHNPSDQNK